MTKMIEQVAQAIARARGEEMGTYWRDHFLEEARAAIVAMREPTREMLLAGGRCIHPGYVWKAMIDAALEEPR